MNARNVIVAIVILVAVVGGYFFFQMRKVQQAAVKWEGPVPEIVSEDIQKDRDLTTVKLASRIDAPIDDVFEAFTKPDQLQGTVADIKLSKVLSGDDQKKQVEFHITTLGQLQVFTVDLTFDKSQKQVGIKTVEGVIDIDGVYALSSSPDGKVTLVSYTATQRNKLPLPVPQDVERSAIKEQFANLMKGVKSVLAKEGKLKTSSRARLRAAA